MPLRLVSDSEELSAAAGRTGIEVFGILDSGLAAAVLKQIDDDGRNA